MFDADFRGNIYVVQEGRVICERSSGYADLPNKTPNTLGRLLKRDWYDIDPKVTVRQLLTHDVSEERGFSTTIPAMCCWP